MMKNFSQRALIVDDEAHLRRYLIRLLNKLWPELDIMAEAGEGSEALQIANEQQPDVIFLDIRMPGLDGISVARQLTYSCHLVFVTAYDDYAVKAFEQAAIDYLLKPVKEQRLQQTIQRIKQHTAPELDLTTLTRFLAEREPKETINWLKVLRNEEIKILAVETIDYFRSQDKYTSVYTEGREWIVRTPLKELEARISEKQFWRIHRSTIIRVAAIERVEKDLAGRYLVFIKGYEKPLNVSRSHAHLFKVN